MKTDALYVYVGCQLAVAILVILLGYGVGGVDAAMSLACGSAIMLLSQAYFTLQAFRHRATRNPLIALGAIYRGGVGKYVIVMVLCALTFRYVGSVEPVLLIVAITVMVITQCAASIVLQHKYEDAEQLAVSDKEID